MHERPLLGRGLGLVCGLAASLVAHAALATCPSISGVSPNPYSVGSAQQITIAGSGFCTTSGCNSVTIHGVAAAVVTGSRSSSGLKVNDPGLGAGASYDVAVTQGTCAVAHAAITYQNPIPTISSVTSGGTGGGAFGSTAGINSPGGAYSVTVTGANFSSGATIVFDSFGSGATSVSSSTSLTASIYGFNWPAGAGTVQICNPGPNTPCSAPSPFTFIAPPAVYTVTPAVVAAGQSTSFAITGANLDTIGGLTACAKIVQTGSSTACAAVGSTSLTTLALTWGVTAQGSYALRVYGGDSSHQGNDRNGLFADYAGITFLATPTVSSVTGANPQATTGGYSITIAGANFASGDIVLFYYNGYWTGWQVWATFLNSSTMTVTAPPMSPDGTYAIAVRHSSTLQLGPPGGSLQYISPPSIAGIDEQYAMANTSNSTRVISGSGFAGAVSCAVKVGGGVRHTKQRVIDRAHHHAPEPRRRRGCPPRLWRRRLG